MNSKLLFTGEDLEQIYLEDKSNDLLKDPNNLKKLLNYALNKKDTIDSNFDMEIIDFCVDGLESQVTIDDERIAFMKEKQEFIARERDKKRHFYSIGKMAAAAAMFVVIVGVAVFGNVNESEAGVFDWIRSLIIKEKDGGEQLSFSSPDATMMAIEREEGHLPDSLPDKFTFDTSFEESVSTETRYYYRFKYSNASILTIQIVECNDSTTLSNMELEINKDSYEIKEYHNQTYYYRANMDITSISWMYNNLIYIISGNFEIDTLEDILSFYQEEQLKS